MLVLQSAKPEAGVTLTHPVSEHHGLVGCGGSCCFIVVCGGLTSLSLSLRSHSHSHRKTKVLPTQTPLSWEPS